MEKKYKDDGGFAVKCDNKCDNTSIHGSIALEESNKPDDCEINNLSEHHYKEIPSARASIEDMYIDDMTEDQKKYMDKISDTNQIPKRFYHTLEDLNKKDNNTCECKGACYIYITRQPINCLKPQVNSMAYPFLLKKLFMKCFFDRH